VTNVSMKLLSESKQQRLQTRTTAEHPTQVGWGVGWISSWDQSTVCCEPVHASTIFKNYIMRSVDDMVWPYRHVAEIDFACGRYSIVCGRYGRSPN